jgi:hypothetical protein
MGNSFVHRKKSGSLMWERVIGVAEFHVPSKTFYDARMASCRQFCDLPPCPEAGKGPKKRPIFAGSACFLCAVDLSAQIHLRGFGAAAITPAREAGFG